LKIKKPPSPYDEWRLSSLHFVKERQRDKVKTVLAKVGGFPPFFHPFSYSLDLV
jgi:hypothetical protein